MDSVFHSIIRAAIDLGASDIHIKPEAPVVFRIQRELVTVDAPPQTEAWIRAVLTEIVPEHLRDRLYSEHEIDFALTLPGLARCRTNVFQQRGQFTLALRIVKTAIRTLADLRMPPIIAQVSQAPRGIILVAGAIGAGKSTTLAGMINHINTTSRKHVITLEDPIEYIFEDNLSIIEQREVGLDTASFNTGLRNVLRQDPDVLVIGEMRDAESAAAAMGAANIGHLVISTLHTSDTVKSVQRVLEFFPSGEREYARRLFADTLHAVVCQRLIKSEAHGVIPAVEILLNNASVSKLIASDRLDKLQGALELGIGEGMQTFDHALQQMTVERLITREEAILHAANPDSLRMAFKGVVLSESRRILSARD
ncbi:MAG: Twitching motility protein [Chthoniobacteraceae bacterium]|nr:Twitching motility protein [Chthoniobacteraceae bacterium]MDB6171393.1 Twitching motility protein [Chthoniobacteraceae bacterium]